MNSGKAALMYNITDTVRSRKIKLILARLGIRIKVVDKKDYLQPVGYLAGIKGIDKISGEYEGQGFSDEMLVMKDIKGRQLDELINSFRKEKLDKVELKAVITETNKTWNSLELHEEIKKEHAAMSGKS